MRKRDAGKALLQQTEEENKLMIEKLGSRIDVNVWIEITANLKKGGRLEKGGRGGESNFFS